jgi:hypothetical protein
MQTEAKRVSFSLKDGRTIYGQRDQDGNVHVWVGNGPQIGVYRAERFSDPLTGSELRSVLLGGAS